MAHTETSGHFENRLDPELVRALNVVLGTGTLALSVVLGHLVCLISDNAVAHKGPSAVVITGRGKFFSNGHDMRWLQRGEETKTFLDSFYRLLARIMTCPVSVSNCPEATTACARDGMIGASRGSNKRPRLRGRLPARDGRRLSHHAHGAWLPVHERGRYGWPSDTRSPTRRLKRRNVLKEHGRRPR